MILTFKIKHHRDFSIELAKAKQIAQFAIETRARSSADVKQFGLKSVISCQIIRKYAQNKNCKQAHKVNLIVPNQGIKLQDRKAYISSLKLELDLSHLPVFQKINQIELNKEFAFVSVTVAEEPQKQAQNWIGVDRNTTGHCAVVASPSTGKVLKLGKEAYHTHQKYKNLRTNLRKKGKFRLLKKTKNKESRIIRDLNHKISKGIVNYAVANNAGIVLEDLKDVRKAKSSKSFRASLHSWSYAQLENFIEYKAKLLGIPVAKIDPAYTSQQCSRCGLLGHRNGKHFECSCGHSDHADANAAFTIAERHISMVRLPVDRDAGEGSTDTPIEATA